VGGCNADFIIQNGSLPYSYLFTDMSTAGNNDAVSAWQWIIYDNLQNTLITSTLQNLPFTFQAPGTYNICLNITTDSGCTSTTCNPMTVLDSNLMNCQLTVSQVITNVSTNGGNDGAIDITISGGTPPYTYNWSNLVTTEDINGLTAGVYTVSIGQNDTVCPLYSFTFQVLQPFDSTIIDTLSTFPLDSCLNFLIDTFYITNIVVNQNIVTVTWVFQGGGIVQTFIVTYSFSNYGVYVIAITINCAKTTITYMTLITIDVPLGVASESYGNIDIYPNPFTDQFNLNLPPGVLKADIEVFNYTGQVIYSNKTMKAVSTIDASQWPPSVYLVRVLNAQNQIITRNLIKQ
jgi:hypothetical protein